MNLTIALVPNPALTTVEDKVSSNDFIIEILVSLSTDVKELWQELTVKDTTATFPRTKAEPLLLSHNKMNW